jgi:hypothetical protein
MLLSAIKQGKFDVLVSHNQCQVPTNLIQTRTQLPLRKKKKQTMLSMSIATFPPQRHRMRGDKNKVKGAYNVLRIREMNTRITMVPAKRIRVAQMLMCF